MAMDLRQYDALRQQAQTMGQMFSNPSQAMRDLMQRNMNEMIAQQLADWKAEHPEDYRKCQDMLGGKSREQQVCALRKMAKRSNIDLDQLAMQYGIAL